jgi:glutamate dehydrogenase
VVRRHRHLCEGSAENNVEVGDPANDALADQRRGSARQGDRRRRQPWRPRRPGGSSSRCTAGGSTPTSSTIRPGVDCSDNEVNIKIALAAAKRAGRLTEPARVKLLSSMTDEVADLVLEDNRLQALALSIAASRRAASDRIHLRLIETLEARAAWTARPKGWPMLRSICAAKPMAEG